MERTDGAAAPGEPAGERDGDEAGDFRELLRYTLTGYAGGLFVGVLFDVAGFGRSGLGQWLVRTLAGEGESVFEGLFALRRRLSRRTGGMAEAYGWGKLIGMGAPWLVDAVSRAAHVDLYGVEGFYVPYFYAMSDQIGAAVSGFLFLHRRHGSLGAALRAFLRHPVMLAGLVLILGVPYLLLAGRALGFSPTSQVLTAAEQIVANLCWVPPLAGLLWARSRRGRGGRGTLPDS